MTRRSALRDLAERAGVLPGYTAVGGEWRETSDAAREALLAAMGFDVSSEVAARRSLAALEAQERAAPRDVVDGPRRALDPWERLGGRPAFGLWTNLYSLRSERSLAAGIGDLAALGSLVEWAGEAGAAFVGISPLHAVRHHAGEISPYAPSSRLFRNPIYLDLSAIPAWKDGAEARTAREHRELERLDRGSHIDYQGVAAGKRAVLEILHRAFTRRHMDADTDCGRAYRAFRSRRGRLLDDFATFQILEDHFAAQGLARDWHAWPSEFRDPRSPAVASFRESHAQQVDFHAWCQFELDRQLADVARCAGEAGLAIGLCSDLAVGGLGSGFDAWAFPGLFAEGVHLGAPPDDYSDTGQDWGFPPLAPHRLRESGYRFFRRLLRAGFEHAGALRIDHILGLYRQYWVPAGRPATEGAYVRFPTRDLLRLVALESQRQRALVVGEDLGTVPRGLAAILARHGVLSTRVLLFERDGRRRFRSASRYSKRALVTAHTHDHPPLAGFWQGRDLELRRRAGAIASDVAFEAALARREQETRALLRRLTAVRPPEAADDELDTAAFCRAAYRFLARTPAPLVGVSVDDLAGETEPINLPGVPPERFASWTRRMREPVGRVRESSPARDILAALSGRRMRGG